MKRKAFVVLLAGVTFLSAFAGVTALAGAQQNKGQMAPRAIADKPKPTPTPITLPGPDLFPDGNSWGG